VSLWNGAGRLGSYGYGYAGLVWINIHPFGESGWYSGSGGFRCLQFYLYGWRERFDFYAGRRGFGRLQSSDLGEYVGILGILHRCWECRHAGGYSKRLPYE
jgi:hypothetical protein